MRMNKSNGKRIGERKAGGKGEEEIRVGQKKSRKRREEKKTI